jgi:hypothetical protein
MMRTVRAESFTGYRDLKLSEEPRRADGTVLVRIKAAGVTPLDHTILLGGYPRYWKSRPCSTCRKSAGLGAVYYLNLKACRQGRQAIYALIVDDQWMSCCKSLGSQGLRLPST